MKQQQKQISTGGKGA